MSKQGKRKITLELSKSKDLSNRPSVFERLGTKKASSAKKTIEHCRQWAKNGTCAYGKSCKFASTHVLISPSKQRAANKDGEKKLKDDAKSRLHSAVVVRVGRSPEGEIDNWDQNDLEYVDTDVLEKRRLELQRELELQLKMDTGKDSMRKDKKKPVSSSSSSRSSSSSSASSSSSDGSSSSSSSGRDARRKGKKAKVKRNSSSSSDGGTPSKRKFVKSDAKKSDSKKVIAKKDEKVVKKSDPKKKVLTKATVGKKSLSPGKKSGGTPPITSKSFAKTNTKGKSPVRKERNKSASPHSSRDRDKDRGRTKEREKDKERDRDKDKERRARSRSLKKQRSRSPRGHGSKDTRRKDSSERSRPISPKKQVRKDASPDRHRKRSASRDRNKDRSLERRKDKHDDKDRYDRKDRLDRGRDRNKDAKRDDGKRRGRGLGRGASDKGLEKPNKPMERLLPRPEERLAALAAISNRPLDTDKASGSKDRQDTLSERGGRKQDRERDRSGKRLDSMDREQGDYEMDRSYERGHSVERYERGDDRYDEPPRDGDRSPGYNQGRDRHYDPNYDMAGPPRGYPEDGERMYGDREHPGYEDRRVRDRSWEGRAGSMDRERGYPHPQKEWPEDYRGGDWGRERHWPPHDNQMNEWGDKEQGAEGWHHRGPQGPHRGRAHEYGRGMRMEHRGGDQKRRPRVETETAKEVATTTTAGDAARDTDDDHAAPDDLSEISDDPDDILNRDDMIEHNADDDSQTAHTADDSTSKPEGSENQSTQDTNGDHEAKEPQDKDDDENTNLDFEEISDGELEEERTRAGLGDALGVDWASLVADVRRREQTQTATGGARDRWRPERVLTRLGVSLQMAGEATVKNILHKNAELEKAEREARKSDENRVDVVCPEPSVEDLHPVAGIQVAMEKRKRQRAMLFGSGCEITRALSARRDLALRRHLCRLPGAERGAQRATPQPDLFHAARALLMQAPVTG